MRHTFPCILYVDVIKLRWNMNSNDELCQRCKTSTKHGTSVITQPNLKSFVTSISNMVLSNMNILLNADIRISVLKTWDSVAKHQKFEFTI